MSTGGFCACGLALVLAACGTGPGTCTLDIVPAITVRALTADSRENITHGARGTVSDGMYTDSLRPAAFDGAQRVTLLSAADERPGTYDVLVELDGFQAVSVSGFEATAGECHVNTVAVTVTMVPFPE